jgi:hypothetical protein
MNTKLELAQENENLKDALLRINKRLKAFHDECDTLSEADSEIIFDMYLSTRLQNIEYYYSLKNN